MKPSARSIRDRLWQGVIVAMTVLGCSGFSATADEPALSTEPDPAFVTGIVALRKSVTPFKEMSRSSSLEWSPNLLLLIGVKAEDGSKETLRFLELTTVHPPLTNAAGGPWSPPRQTNRFDLTGTNRNPPTTTYVFVSTLYPVHVRVFDPSARLLKEGETTVPWELLTNSLVDACRVSATTANGGNSNDAQTEAMFERPFVGGMLSLVTVFATIQGCPVLTDVCEKARCAVRLPGIFSMAAALVGSNLDVSLIPRFEAVSTVTSMSSDGDATCFRIPVEMKSGQRTLTTIDILTGPSRGANILLAGIRSIRAMHPTKEHHQFMAQILAAGTTSAESGMPDAARADPQAGPRR